MHASGLGNRYLTPHVANKYSIMQATICRQLRHKRQAISLAQKQQYAKDLCAQFSRCYADLLKSKAKKIASYYASSEEISPHLIDQELKMQHEIYYPVLHPFKKRKLLFVRESIRHCHNRYGLEEPLFIADKTISPWELDMIIVPLVGFDLAKNRIGMGGGFYDSSLTLCKAFNNTEFVGIAFDEQQFEQSQHHPLAMNEWDIKMDAIITPTRIIR